MHKILGPKTIHSRSVIFFAIFVLGVFVDQLSKAWARNELVDAPRFIGSTEIGFSLTSNSGSAFSLFQNSTILLTIAGIVIVGILVVVVFRTETVLVSYACMTIATGAVGNLIDRFTQYPNAGHGHVTDFIHVGSFPTFNIADSLVTIGAIALVVSTLFQAKEHHES